MAEPQQPHSRIEWLDALRGFTILLVVSNHVDGFGFGESNGMSSAMSVFLLFRMPLFFFISGFLAYRSRLAWDGHDFRTMLRKKIRIQIIPTLVFLLAFTLMFHSRTFLSSLGTFMHSPMKGGYWFTLVLLYMFIVYYVFEYVVHRLKLNSFASIVILWFLAMVVCETCFLPRLFPWAMGRRVAYKGWLNTTSIIELMKYFHFFVFGNFFHRYWKEIEETARRSGYMIFIIILAFVSTVEFTQLHLITGPWANISRTMAQYSLLMLAFFSFWYYQDSFSSATLIGRKLQYIGKRTLDIYLIHYFLIPHIPEVGEFFNAHKHTFVLNFTLSMLTALLVVAFCLLISNILRISPFLKKYLFGREEKKKQTSVIVSNHTL